MTTETYAGRTYRDVAKSIDHSLLRPELDDEFVADGCRLAARYDVASVCVKPVDVARAAAILAGPDVKVGPAIGFPPARPARARRRGGRGGPPRGRCHRKGHLRERVSDG